MGVNSGRHGRPGHGGRVRQPGFGGEEPEDGGHPQDPGGQAEGRAVGDGVHEVPRRDRPGDGTRVPGHLVGGDHGAAPAALTALAAQEVADHGRRSHVEQPGSEAEYGQRGQVAPQPRQQRQHDQAGG
jgi:hypothetical protein